MLRNITIGLVLVLGLTACGSDQQGDSQREIVAGEVDVEALPPATIAEPDTIDVYLNVEGFRNVARLCIDGTAVFVTSRGGVNIDSSGNISGTASGGSLPSSIAVSPADPGCGR